MKRAANQKLLGLFSVVATVVLMAIALTAGYDSTAQAAEIELTYGGTWPPGHPMSKATQLWIDKIAKETNGRVVIKPFWAGGLYGGKESALELGKGVADVGDLSGAYAPKGFDFEKSMRLAFWGVDDRKLARKVYYEAMAKFPQLEQEFTDANIVVMAYAAIPPYQLLLAKKKVASTDDLKGLTLKASGDFSKLAAAFGAEGIVIPMGESYTALQKSTIDGVFAPYETMKSFRFGEVVKYAVKLDIGSAPAGHWGFNMDRWNKLPKDIQKVFLDNREWFAETIEQLVFANEEKGIAFGKQNGAEFITLSPAELDKVYATVDATMRAQMAKLDEKGLPGTEVYEFMRAKIKEYQK